METQTNESLMYWLILVIVALAAVLSLYLLRKMKFNQPLAEEVNLSDLTPEQAEYLRRAVYLAYCKSFVEAKNTEHWRYEEFAEEKRILSGLYLAMAKREPTDPPANFTIPLNPYLLRSGGIYTHEDFFATGRTGIVADSH